MQDPQWSCGPEDVLYRFNSFEADCSWQALVACGWTPMAPGTCT